MKTGYIKIYGTEIWIVIKYLFLHQALFGVLVGAIGFVIQQERINDLQQQINNINPLATNGYYQYGTSASIGSTYETRIASLESMVSSLTSTANTNGNNIAALSADQTSICTQVWLNILKTMQKYLHRV